MGTKGDKMSADSIINAAELPEKLASIQHLTSKKMFGGHGLFHNDKMFGLIDSKGKGFLKADESNLGYFQAAGSTQHSRMPYYSITEHFQDQEMLLKLALSSI